MFKELARAGLNVGADAEILINYVESPTGIDIPKHYHAGDEFVYMLEGSLVFWQKGKPGITVNKGDLFKVPSMQIHTALIEKEPVKLLIIDIYDKGTPIHVNVDDEGKPIEQDE